MRELPAFANPDEEVRFLRGLVNVQRMADEVLEDCLSKGLGLSAALDVFLTQCARMMHARAAFVQVRGTREPVLNRFWGSHLFEFQRYAELEGSVSLDAKHTLFVHQLTLGELNFGCLGFALLGHFENGGSQVQALVNAIAEMLDTAVLSFLALVDGSSPLEKLDELGSRAGLKPRGRLGKYELLAPLGTGGMAQVLAARSQAQQGVSRLVALKRILPHLADDQNMVAQFLDEAKLGLSLSHPNLITFHDFGKAATGDYYLTMELLRGVDFDHVIYAPPGKISPEMAAGVLVQALEGLHHAHQLKGEDGHSLGLVHRDLSPHNLFVGFDGRVKVLDFGVAKVRRQRTVTLPGIVKGKPLYMSPEQATAEPIDSRSDIFAMGLILYEATVRARAFDTGDDTRTMLAIVNDPLYRPPDMSDAVWELVSKACAKDPAQRYQTAAAMADAVRRLVVPLTAESLGRLVRARFPQQLVELERLDALLTPTSTKQ